MRPEQIDPHRAIELGRAQNVDAVLIGTIIEAAADIALAARAFYCDFPEMEFSVGTREGSRLRSVPPKRQRDAGKYQLESSEMLA